MRVIAGSARGRTLIPPPKPKVSGRPGPRPTSDMVRGAVFDMLDSLGAGYDRVLDLYAGTGALGIEALSRGEGTADFVESDRTMVRIVEQNLERTGFSERAHVYGLTAESVTARLRGPYTLVLADPPYYDEGAIETVRAIAASPLVDAESVFVFEHHRSVPVAEDLGLLRLYRSRRHGDTVISIYTGEAFS